MKKSRYKTLLAVSIFGLLGFFVSLASGKLSQILFYFCMFAVFLVLYIKLEKTTIPRQSAPPAAVDSSAPAPATAPVPAPASVPESSPYADTNSSLDDIDVSDFVHVSLVDNRKPSYRQKPVRDSHYKYETHRISGTSFRQSDIESLGIENDEYDYTKRMLIDDMREDERIYEYIFYPSKVELIEEPDNKYDSNAIKVIIDGVLVGYIKKGSCSHVKKLLHSGKINDITATIGGGKYKQLYSEYDDEKDDDVYRLEKGKTDYFVSIELRIDE